jgi:sulfite reductase (ferredoxin)
MRSGLRAVIQQLAPQVIVTAQQNIILGGIAPAQKSEVERLMQLYGIPPAEAISPVRRNAMACPALPTCSLAIAEAERFLPSVIDQVEEDLSALGLEQEQFTIRMTGCPNGCARPYVADIGIVGRSGEKYSVYFGGNPEGTRLNELFADLVPAANLRTVIRGVLEQFVAGRQSGERLAEFVARVGVAALHVHPAP